MFQRVFIVRVVYKSGYVHDFECVKFSIKGANHGTWSWEGAHTKNTPVLLGVDEIAAVWQVGVRYRLRLWGGNA